VGNFLFAYLPQGGTLTIDVAKLSGKRIGACWFNPRNGKVTTVGEFERGKSKSFETPRIGRIWDWVLVLDSVAE